VFSELAWAESKTSAWLSHKPVPTAVVLKINKGIISLVADLYNLVTKLNASNIVKLPISKESKINFRL
jgi:hypothetical protein